MDDVPIGKCIFCYRDVWADEEALTNCNEHPIYLEGDQVAHNNCVAQERISIAATKHLIEMEKATLPLLCDEMTRSEKNRRQY